MRKITKHEPADSYFYLARQLDKFMMRYDTFNFHVDPERTEMNSPQWIPILKVYSSDKSESKGVITDKNHCKSVLRTRDNKKDLSLMKVL